MKLKRFNQFGQVNEKFTFQDLKKTIGEVKSKIGKGLTKAAAMSLVLGMMAKSELTQAQTQQLQNDLRQIEYRSEEKHRVTKGETLYALSRYYGVSLEDLKAANGLKTDNIYVGQELIIPTGESFPKMRQLETDDDAHVVFIPEEDYERFGMGEEETSEPSSVKKFDDYFTNDDLVFYRLKQGDNLYGIGKITGLSMDDIMEYNDNIQNPDTLKELDVILLPRKDAQSLQDRHPYTDPNETEVYIVKQGDTPSKIAREFGTTVEDILVLNGKMKPFGQDDGTIPNIKLAWREKLIVPKKNY